MRIGVDACCWSNRRGFGRFTRELLRELVAGDRKNEYLFFVDQATASLSDFPEGIAKLVAQTKAPPTTAASASGRRSLKDLWSLSRQVLKHQVDLFFFPAVYSYFPVLNRSKIIVTLHDVIAELHPDLVFPNKRLQLFWDLKRNLAIRQAHLILTVSQHSKRQLVNFLRLPERRIRSISEAADPVFTACAGKNGDQLETLRKYGLRMNSRFLLYVGGISPHKNLNTLLNAFREVTLAPSFADVRLVLVGDYQDDPFHSSYSALMHQINDTGLKDKVVFTGFVTDQDLAILYGAATAFVLPSFEEGFGLPAIEAMACGAPVVCSDRGSLREIVAEAGLFFNPADVTAMAQALKCVLADDRLRQQMRERGVKRAPLFTWKKAAKDTLAIFEEVAATK
jgi:glycosyltransferase involved in cell wall biosynthesis